MPPTPKHGTDRGWPFYEFFAGGGMARLGLGGRWRCDYVNEWDSRKAEAYQENFPSGPRVDLRDVAKVRTDDLPGRPVLAWASFPCQDLSLAGQRGGLAAPRSGSFWPFWNLVRGLGSEGRPPAMIVLENVVGAITSHGGADFQALARVVTDAGYRFGALVLDAVRFVPQSRPRLFIVAVHGDLPVPGGAAGSVPRPEWTTPALERAWSELPTSLKDLWVWWQLPAPPPRREGLGDLLETGPHRVSWNPDAVTVRLMDMMTPVNRRKIEDALHSGATCAGTLYRRSRPDANGRSVQRAEVRFDGVAGCLRTPAGGSSRQTLLVVDRGRVRSRLLSPREAARLMGVPESYSLPARPNEAYHLLGDGVVAPVVSWLERGLLAPMARTASGISAKASRRRDAPEGITAA